MDYTVYSGEWPIGRIYEERGSRADQRWFWSVFGILANPPDMRTNGRAPTLEAAKAEFEANWRQMARMGKAGRGGLRPAHMHSWPHLTNSRSGG
jgi:hypothetical protein